MFRIQKTTEFKTLKTRIEIHEGDDAAPVPGGFYGSITLADENGDVVQRTALGPEDLDPIVQQLTGLKTRAVADSGAVFVADALAESVLEEVKK